MARRQINTEQLDNGVETPGNSEYYGTNAGGVKGFHAIPAGGTDELVKVSANDTTAGYLIDKIVDDTNNNINIQEVNDGGDEDARVQLNTTLTNMVSITTANLSVATQANFLGADVNFTNADIDLANSTLDLDSSSTTNFNGGDINIIGSDVDITNSDIDLVNTTLDLDVNSDLTVLGDTTVNNLTVTGTTTGVTTGGVGSGTREVGSPITLRTSEVTGNETRGSFLNDSPWIYGGADGSSIRKITTADRRFPMGNISIGAGTANAFAFADDGAFFYTMREDNKDVYQIPRASDQSVGGNWTIIYNADTATGTVIDKFVGVSGNGNLVFVDETGGSFAVYEVNPAGVVQSNTGFIAAGMTNRTYCVTNSTTEFITNSGLAQGTMTSGNYGSGAVTTLGNSRYENSGSAAEQMIGIDNLVYMAAFGISGTSGYYAGQLVPLYKTAP